MRGSSIDMEIKANVRMTRCEDCVFGERSWEVFSMGGAVLGWTFNCHLAPPQMSVRNGAFVFPEIMVGPYQGCGLGVAPEVV